MIANNTESVMELPKVAESSPPGSETASVGGSAPAFGHLQSTFGNAQLAAAATTRPWAEPLLSMRLPSSHRNAAVARRLTQRKAESGGTETTKGAAIPSAATPLAAPTETPGTVAPPEVNQVLSSPGEPLESTTRSALEGHLGADLSAIRIHTDAPAAASAQSVDAGAYTVGSHIAFAAGEFAPNTPSGERLLLHEAAHTLQQRRESPPDFEQPLEVGPANDHLEAEADAAAAASGNGPGPPPLPRGSATLRLQRDKPVDVDLAPVSPEEAERLRRQGIQLPAVGPQTWAAIGGSPYATILPGYSQAGDTCGAASLVSALVIWDREHWNPAEPNSRIVTACNLILIELQRHGDAAVRGWAARPSPEISRLCNGDQTCINQAFNLMRHRIDGDLRRIRDAGQQPGARISQADYQALGLTLYFLWNQGGRAGLDSGQIERIQESIGLRPSGRQAPGNIQSFDDIFSHPIISGLQPDQFTQVFWLTRVGMQHAFLVGRLESGEWILTDQGAPAEFRAATLPDLRATVRTAAASGSYWLFVGSHADYMSRGGPIPSWTGVRLLASHTAVESKAQNLIVAGVFLGEVDAGYLTTGDRLTRDAFMGRRNTLVESQGLFSTSTPGGALIIEMPVGVFSLYTTSPVSADNVSETSLDAADSSGGVLATRTFLHAWLILGTATGRHGRWFSVY